MEPMSLEHRPSVIEPLLNLASTVLEQRSAWRDNVGGKEEKAYLKVRPGEQCVKSSLIEGSIISLDEADTAIKYKKGPKSFVRAHLVASEWAEKTNLLSLGICEFLLGLHNVYVTELPSDPDCYDDSQIHFKPGKWRTVNVQVGAHLPPRSSDVAACMQRFEAVYFPILDKGIQGRDQLMALVHGFIAHHRLVWIHPFDDYNGRLSRIFLDKWLSVCGLPGSDLLTISSGFAVDGGEQYKALLHNADLPRAGALDGRGNLSERELVEFVRFCLKSSIPGEPT